MPKRSPKSKMVPTKSKPPPPPTNPSLSSLAPELKRLILDHCDDPTALCLSLTNRDFKCQFQARYLDLLPISLTTTVEIPHEGREFALKTLLNDWIQNTFPRHVQVIYNSSTQSFVTFERSSELARAYSEARRAERMRAVEEKRRQMRKIVCGNKLRAEYRRSGRRVSDAREEFSSDEEEEEWDEGFNIEQEGDREVEWALCKWRWWEMRRYWRGSREE